jgi:hypothetical protein
MLPSTNPHEIGHWLQLRFFGTLPLFELWKNLNSLGCHLLKNNWSVAYDINYICTCSATCKGGMQVWVFNLFVCQNSIEN